MPRSSVASLVLTLALALASAACSRGPCEETCRRVAVCKQAKSVGQPILGETAPPADPTCLSRCEAATPEYTSCEGKKRECDAVLQCITY